MSENTQLVLIGGKSATGKSASLMGLRDPERVAYMNCENNKRLPFPAKFTQANVTATSGAGFLTVTYVVKDSDGSANPTASAA